MKYIQVESVNNSSVTIVYLYFVHVFKSIKWNYRIKICSFYIPKLKWIVKHIEVTALTMTSRQPSRPKQIGAFGKVRLLLWKNFLIQIRHWVHTIFDLLLPIGVFSLIIWIHSKTGKSHNDAKVYPSQDIDHFPYGPWPE